MQEYKIRNDLILTLAGLFVLYAVLAGDWASLKWDLAFAASMFVVMLAFLIACGWMGGGDVKILGGRVSLDRSIWRAAIRDLARVFFSSILPTALAAKFGWVKMARSTDSRRRRIPFAPSVAGALICTFMLQIHATNLAPVIWSVSLNFSWDPKQRRPDGFRFSR